MMRFATDENFSGDMLKGLQERMPDLDIIRVQDTIMYGRPDNKLLEWLAGEGRILITHDKRTIRNHIKTLYDKGIATMGAIIVLDSTPIGKAIEDLELCIVAGNPEDFENQ